MILTFVDKNVDVCDALAETFEEHAMVYNDDIMKYGGDFILAPGNSFGIMNGGIDLVYRDNFKHIENIIRNVIKKDFNGEMLVGQAYKTLIGNKNIRGLIYAPTMRVPMKIVGTVNVYLAFRAALTLIWFLGDVAVLSPGFGTLTGGMSPIVAAKQMWYAYQEVVLGKEISIADHYNIVNGTL